MSSITNIPIASRSMNGVITISDGTATLENGDLTNVNNIDTSSITADNFTTNDFSINTNLDLNGDTSHVRFLYASDPTNTDITRASIFTPKITIGTAVLAGFELNVGGLSKLNQAVTTTPALHDNSKMIPTTEWVANEGYARVTDITNGTLTYTGNNTFAGDVNLQGASNFTGAATFNEITFSNVSTPISITNYNFAIPTYPAGNNTIFTGTGTYSSYSGWIFSGTSYSAIIVSGLYQTPYYQTYYPVSPNQALVMNPSAGNPMTAQTTNKILEKGEYIFSVYLQNQNYGTAPNCDIYVKTSGGVILAQKLDNNPSASYPNWIQVEMVFTLSSTTSVYFQFVNSDAYICVDGLSLVLSNCMVITDGTNTSTIAGNQSILNNLYVKDGLSVVSGGIVATGGIFSGTDYGTNNTTMNTIMGSSPSSNNNDNVCIGVANYQNASTSNRNVSVGVGANQTSTTNNDCVVLGYTANSANINNACVIGSKASARGNDAIVIGYNNSPITQGGTAGAGCVSIGSTCLQRYNGYGVLTSAFSTNIGYASLFNCADNYNTAIGAYSHYNMSGSNGVTANANNGYITQYNSSLGYQTGYTYSRYNNCTFIGAKSDTTADNLTGVTCIGYNTKCGTSNTIQLGSNSEAVNISGALNVTGTITGTINGVVLTTTNQTIDGVKTFSSSPVISDTAMGSVVFTNASYTIPSVFPEMVCFNIGATALTITFPTAGATYLGTRIKVRRVAGTTTTALNSASANIYQTNSLTASNVVLASGVYTTCIMCGYLTASTYGWFKIY